MSLNRSTCPLPHTRHPDKWQHVSGGIGGVHYGGPVCTGPPGLGDGGQVYPEGSEPAWESGDRAFEIE
jgi:hypothetical protein